MEKKGSHQKVEDLYNDVTQFSIVIHAYGMTVQMKNYKIRI